MSAVFGITHEQWGAAGKLILQNWKKEQLRLKQWLKTYNELDFELDSDNDLKLIGGVDISFDSRSRKGEHACAALVVMSWPSLDVVYSDLKKVRLKNPYMSGFLAFREVEFLVDLVKDLQTKHPQFVPQVIVVDGNGVFHPREFGLACHLGVLTGIPTIGVGKSILALDGINQENFMQSSKAEKALQKRGDTFLMTGISGKDWGVALKSTSSSHPIFVSIGHRIGLSTATEIVKRCCLTRIPFPVHVADEESRKFLASRREQHERKLKAHDKPRIRIIDRITTIHDTSNIEVMGDYDFVQYFKYEREIVKPKPPKVSISRNSPTLSASQIQHKQRKTNSPYHTTNGKSKSPAVKSSGAMSAEAKSPAVKSPAVKSPAAQFPASKSPAAKAPATKSIAAKSPATKYPRTNPPTDKSPTAKPPAVKSSTKSSYEGKDNKRVQKTKEDVGVRAETTKVPRKSHRKISKNSSDKTPQTPGQQNKQTKTGGDGFVVVTKGRRRNKNAKQRR